MIASHQCWQVLTLPMVCSFPGSPLPGCRFDGIRKPFRCIRGLIVEFVDMVIRMPGRENKKKKQKQIRNKILL